MTISDLRMNIAEAKKIIGELKNIKMRLTSASPINRRAFLLHVESSFSRLMLVNRAIPDILKNISSIKKLGDPSLVQKKGVVNFKYTSINSGNESSVSLKKEDKDRFLKELSLSETNLRKTGSLVKEKRLIRPNFYAIISTKIFGILANKFSVVFKDLKKDLQDSNSRFLLSTYLSMAMFTTFLAFVFSILFLVFLGIIGLSAVSFIWLPLFALFVLPICFYLIPSMNKSSVNKNISNELPFAVIYMSAIAGSNIEPTKIFRIISDSEEYKNIGVEMKKVISQVEVYGYDLVSALKNVAKITINKRLSELLNGMAINISSGSSLKNYLDKKSDSLLMDYKLDRNKYNDVAATFMDIYISVLITAPLILVMLVVIMDLTNLKFGALSTNALLTLSISLVGLVNIFFLIFLQVKQPKV